MSRPNDEFRPPFCPSRHCRHHREPDGFAWIRFGTFRRERPPHVVQRYRCRACGVTFSRQSFRTTYWLKRPELLPEIFRRLLGCSSLRQIARDNDCAHSTVMRQSSRIGRHCLLVHELWRPKGPPREPLVLDSFETFEHSQYTPTHFHLLVGAESHFIYSFTDSELRRSGRMTDYQKRRRAELEAKHGRPARGSRDRDLQHLLETVIPEGSEVELVSDEDPSYPRVLRKLTHRRFEHRTISSKARRTGSNPLFPVNLADLLIRHSGANHERETIAFNKRRQSGAERLVELVVWRNLIKPWSENAQDACPGERLGLVSRKLTVEEVLAWRLFPDRVGLPERWQAYYDRRVSTRRLDRECRHELTYAY